MSELKKPHLRQQWTTIVNADDSGFVWSLKELSRYKDLLFVLVKKDLTSIFKQTALGPVWVILNPIISTLIFALVLGYFARVQTDEVPVILFYLTGGIVWNYFSNAFINVSNALIFNSHIINKVYIPRIILPLSAGITALIKFIFVGLVCLPVFGYYAFTGQAAPNFWLAAFPFLLLLLFATAMGMGMIFSSLMVQRRDLGVIMPFLTSVMMFLSPVLYPVSIVPENFQIYYSFNPLTGIIECFRYGITGAGKFMPYMLINSTVLTIAVFLAGIFLFKRANTKIPDYI